MSSIPSRVHPPVLAVAGQLPAFCPLVRFRPSSAR